MSVGLALVGLVGLQRVAELVWARRNAAALMAQGGREVGARHYPWLVVFHAAWLVAVAGAAWRTSVIDGVALALFVLLQAARVWVLVSLGPRWTTRVIVVPGAPLVRRGPYRWARHPNYLIVAGELAALPMVFGAWPTAVLFSALHLPLLIHRIRVENAALASGHGDQRGADPAVLGEQHVEGAARGTGGHDLERDTGRDERRAQAGIDRGELRPGP